jgi:hypothetical protein
MFTVRSLAVIIRFLVTAVMVAWIAVGCVLLAINGMYLYP